MALPTYKASGVFTAGTGAITPPYPTTPNAPVAGDIAILVVESENQVISLTTANGFVELGAQANKAAGTAAVDPANRIATYWKRCAGGDSAPVVAAPGNHATAQIHLFAGCIASGNAWDVISEGNDGGANDLTGVIPGATTTVVDCLVVLIQGTSWNGNSTAEFTGWANADLASILERTDNSNTSGLGGGHGMATGTKAGIGAYGNTTVTLAHTCYKGAMSIALKPPTVVIEYGTATLSGAGTLAGIGTRARTVACTASGAGTLAGAAYRIRTSLSVLTGSGVLAAIGQVIECATPEYGSATLFGAGTLQTIGARLAAATATASGMGTIIAVGRRVGAGAAGLVGSGLVVASGLRVRTTAGALSGIGNIASTGTRLRVAIASLVGTGALTAAGRLIAGAVGSLSGTGTVAGIGQRIRTAVGGLVGSGNLVGNGMRIRTNTGTLLGGGQLSAGALRLALGKAIVTGVGSLSAIGRIVGGAAVEYGSALLSGMGALTASAAKICRGAGSLVGMGRLGALGFVAYLLKVVLTDAAVNLIVLTDAGVSDVGIGDAALYGVTITALPGG